MPCRPLPLLVSQGSAAARPGLPDVDNRPPRHGSQVGLSGLEAAIGRLRSHGQRDPRAVRESDDAHLTNEIPLPGPGAQPHLNCATRPAAPNPQSGPGSTSPISVRTSRPNFRQGTVATNVAWPARDHHVCPNALNPGRTRWDCTRVCPSPTERSTAWTLDAAVGGAPRKLQSCSAAALSEAVMARRIRLCPGVGLATALATTATATGTLTVDLPGAGSP